MRIDTTKLDKKTIETCAAWVADALKREKLPPLASTKAQLESQKYRIQGLEFALSMLDVLKRYADENRTDIECFDR